MTELVPCGEERNEWFADTDPDAPPGFPWQPVLQMAGCCASVDTWFQTKAECEEFIRAQILTASNRIDP